MQVQVVYLPRDLKPQHLHGRAVVVLDVLRATTSMIAALDAGASEIRIFDSLDAARAAARGFAGASVLCGEERCKRPADFDLGNSPADFDRERVQGHTLFMSTTNGTRALVAAQAAKTLFVAALVNARATAEALLDSELACTILCAGTDGEPSVEDVIGAGAIINSALQLGDVSLENDEAVIAARADQAARESYRVALRSGAGARNLMNAGLEQDIDAAARADSMSLVAGVRKGETGEMSVLRRRQSV